MVAAAAGSKEGQRTCTRRLYCHVANAVPQTDALLFVPSKVAGVAEGSAANKAGSTINPPPPTMESTKPANAEARVVKSISIRRLWSVKKGAHKAAQPVAQRHGEAREDEPRVGVKEAEEGKLGEEHALLRHQRHELLSRRQLCGP